MEHYKNKVSTTAYMLWRNAALVTGFNRVVTHYLCAVPCTTRNNTHDNISSHIAGLTREAAWRTGIIWVVSHYFFWCGWFGGRAESDA